MYLPALENALHHVFPSRRLPDDMEAEANCRAERAGQALQRCRPSPALPLHKEKMWGISAIFIMARPQSSPLFDLSSKGFGDEIIVFACWSFFLYGICC